MFNLKNNQLYTWHHLLLILSLERMSIFLGDIEFPLGGHVEDVQQISRTFVRRFQEIESGLFAKGKVSDIGTELFTSLYKQISAKLGQDDAKKFCQWGDELQIDSPFERYLLRLWENLLLKLIDEKNPGKVPLPNVLQQKSFIIKAAIIRCKTELLGICDALDVLELMPKTGWDLEAYRLYNDRDHQNILDTEIKLSPLEYFEAVVTYVKIRRLVCQIRKLFVGRELDIFFSWITSEQITKLELSPDAIVRVWESIEQ